MDEVRKLKRGLKDISTLFEDKAELPVVKRAAPRNLLPEASIQLISLAHPRRTSSLNLYKWMASQTSKGGYPAGIVSLGPETSREDSFSLKKELFTHKRMGLAEFEKNCAALIPPAGIPESSLLFIDIPWQNAAVFEKTIGLLDKVIFWATPEMGDLSQVYKWIKWTASLNGRLECLLAYDGENEAKGSFVYEKLSEMVSRHIGIDLSWFGCHPVSGIDNDRLFDFELLLSHTNPLTLGEKKALAWSVKAS
jgi:hypothetical protein